MLGVEILLLGILFNLTLVLISLGRVHGEIVKSRRWAERQTYKQAGEG